MHNCSEYIELISAYVDDELPETDRARLEDHMNACNNCASILEIYREISLSIEESSASPPESLCGGVMERIRSEDTERSAANMKKFKLVNRILTRYIPVAACLAFLLLTVPRLFRTGGPNVRSDNSSMSMSLSSPSAASSAAQVPAGGGNSLDGAARDSDENNAASGGSFSAPGAAYGEGAEMPEEAHATVSGAESGRVSAGAAPAATYDVAQNTMGDYEEDREIVEFEASAAPQPSGAPAPSMMQEQPEEEPPAPAFPPEALDMDEESMYMESGADEYFEGIYAIIMISGKMPDSLTGYEPENEANSGELSYTLPRAAAEALIGEISGRNDVIIRYADENGGYALVYYTP